jgi:hypothetical protein
LAVKSTADTSISEKAPVLLAQAASTRCASRDRRILFERCRAVFVLM